MTRCSIYQFKKKVLCLLTTTIFIANIMGYQVSSSQADDIDKPHVVINELYYTEYETNHLLTWIELYNPTGRTYPVRNWYLVFHSSIFWIGANFTISPGEFIVICENISTLKNTWNIPTGVKVIQLSSKTIIEHGFVALYNGTPVASASQLIDDLRYGNDPKKAPLVPKGHALARYKGGFDTDDCYVDFYDEPSPTPGYENHKVKLSGPKKLTNVNGWAQIEVDQYNNLYVLRLENRDKNAVNELYIQKFRSIDEEIYEKKITDRQCYLTQPTVVPCYPKFAVDKKGNTHITWADNIVLNYIKLDPFGNMLTHFSLSSPTSSHPVIAIDSYFTVYIMFSSNPVDDNLLSLYYIKIVDGNMSEPRLLTHMPYSLSLWYTPLVDENDNVHFLWLDGTYHQISYTKINVYGEIIINNSDRFLVPNSHTFTAIMGDNNTIILSWFEGKNMYYSIMNNYGQLTQHRTKIPITFRNPWSYKATIYQDKTLHIFWLEYEKDIHHITLNLSNNVVDNETMVTLESNCTYFSVAEDSANTIHIIWVKTKRGYDELYYGTFGKTYYVEIEKPKLPKQEDKINWITVYSFSLLLLFLTMGGIIVILLGGGLIKIKRDK